MHDVALLGVDWGSSSARALCIATDGSVVDVRRSADGVFAAEGDFDLRLRRLLGDWLERWPTAPILLCGMVGSDRGWRIAPYAAAPAGLDDLAAALVAVPFDRPAYIVPGLSFRDGETCEVMRGEESLLMGLADPAEPVTVCLPGTHSKWAELAAGRIASFRTYVTGELRALLLAGGSLAASVPQVASSRAFQLGLGAAKSGAGPTQSLFQARARRLLGTLAAEHTASFVSGVLIGAEIAREGALHAPVVLAARGVLADEYGAALSYAGHAVTLADPEALAGLGLWRIAGQARLLAGAVT